MAKDAKFKVPKEFLGAFKHGHRRGVREYIDDELSYELLRKAKAGDKQALKALKWITKYNNEIYRGVLKKGDPKAIHKTKKLYKQATDSHNARRRDALCVLRSGKFGPPCTNILFLDEKPKFLDHHISKDQNVSEIEEIFISLVTHPKK